MNSLSKAMQSKIRTQSRERLLHSMNSGADQSSEQHAFKSQRSHLGGKQRLSSHAAID